MWLMNDPTWLWEACLLWKVSMVQRGEHSFLPEEDSILSSLNIQETQRVG